MAKQLLRQQAISGAARLFRDPVMEKTSQDSAITENTDTTLAAIPTTSHATRVIEKPHVEPTDSTAMKEIEVDTPRIKREFVLTKRADQTLNRLTQLLIETTDSNLTRSHLLRAILQVFDDAMESLQERAFELPGLKRPANGKEDQAKRIAYETAISGFFKQVLKSPKKYGEL